MERINCLNKQLSGKQDFFAQLAMAPPDAILNTTVAFKNDKVNSNSGFLLLIFYKKVYFVTKYQESN